MLPLFSEGSQELCNKIFPSSEPTRLLDQKGTIQKGKNESSKSQILFFEVKSNSRKE